MVTGNDKEYSHASGWLRFGRTRSLQERSQGAERPGYWKEISKDNDGRSGGEKDSEPSTELFKE